MPSQYATTDYPLDYKEAFFYAWYQAERSTAAAIRNMHPAPDGRKPTTATVDKWKEGGDGWENWHEHADRLDAQLSLSLDKDAIKRRAKVLKKLAEDGELLKNSGLDYIKNNPEAFKDNPSAAVRAIVAGAEMQYKYSGMSETLANIASMPDKALTKELMQLLGKNENDNSVIDGVESTDSDVPREDADSNPQDDLD